MAKKSLIKADQKPEYMTFKNRKEMRKALFSPEELAVIEAKEHLQRAIVKYVKDRKLKQIELAALLDDHQSNMSDLLKGDLSRFSLDTMYKFYVKLFPKDKLFSKAI